VLTEVLEVFADAQRLGVQPLIDWRLGVLWDIAGREAEASRWWYLTHKEQTKARAIAWQKANPERYREIKRRHYQRHREEILAKAKARRRAERGPW